MLFFVFIENEKENAEGRRGRMTKNWFFRDDFTFSHLSHVKLWLRLTPKMVGWQINKKSYWMTWLRIFSLWLQLQMVFDDSWRETYSSAKIRFVAPNCVYTSNWAHEVMAMQDVYLCIVEVQQWSVCKVIDTSIVLCNYTIIITHRIQRRTPCFKHDHCTTVHYSYLTIKSTSTFWHASFLVTCVKNESRLKSS